MTEIKRLREALASLPEALRDYKPEVIITLGSGLKDLVDRLEYSNSVPYTDILVSILSS